MEIIKFTLSGKTAFFKMPDVNSYLYFSYGQIHKISILGILGAILGYEGYNQQGTKKFPEFYEKLKNLKISIIPSVGNGIFKKKIQTFNNSVGYASFEEGGNLIVKEEWLEDVSWDILILNDNKSPEEAEILSELKKRLLNLHFEYNIYLGKNDHFANLGDVEILKCENIEVTNGIEIKSLFLKDSVEKLQNIKKENPFKKASKNIYRYQEKLPYQLHEQSNQYIVNTFVFTNEEVAITNRGVFKKVNGRVVEFY